MRIILKRFTLGVMLLASLMLLLQGCGSYSDSSAPFNNSVSKKISGKVSDLTSNLPISGAQVTAYTIENGSIANRKVLSETVISGKDGTYSLHIPISYTGSVQIEAVIPGSIARLVKMVFATTPLQSTIRAVVTADQLAHTVIPPVNLNFASDVLVAFIEQNIINAETPPAGFTKTGFSQENIQKATVVLETFFGPHFTETGLPKNDFDTTTTKSQQDLLVSITAINSVINSGAGITLADIVTKLATTGLGDQITAAIQTGIETATAELIKQGTLPQEYVPSVAILSALSNAQNAPVLPPTLVVRTPPPATSNLTAVNLNAKTVTLSWTAATGSTGYSIYRADDSGVYSLIDTLMNVTGNPVRFTDTTVSPSTKYSYKVLAFDADRNYSQVSDNPDVSNVATITTLPLVVVADSSTPITQPVGLVSKGFTADQVNIQWLQSTKTYSDGSVVPASGYYVFRNGQIIATATDTSYIDKTVAPVTEYDYYIKSFDANGVTSVASTPLLIRTQPLTAAVRPVAPVNLTNTSLSYNKVILAWGASTTPGTTYNIYRGSELIGTGIKSSPYTDNNVIASSTYIYTVTAVTATSESTNNPTVTVQVPVSSATVQTAPSVPLNLALVSDATSSSVPLIWTASTKTDGDKIVAGYDVLRGDNAGNNFVVIASVATPGYTDNTTGITPVNSTFTYQIRSFSTTGTRSEASLPITVIMGAPVNIADITPPTAPTNLAYTLTGNTVVLTWTASTDLIINGKGDGIVAGYRIYRGGSQIGVVKNVGFVDQTADALTSYIYTVKAYDNPGNVSVASNSIKVDTLPPSAELFSLTGKVTYNGIGLPGVVLTLIGSGSGSTSTDANGNYQFTNIKNGSYSISATKSTYLFNPVSRSVLVINANVSALDFVAYNPGTVTGGVTYPNGTITGGITYPPGTIIGGITYPAGTVIGGVTYTHATVIGGVTYPTGEVIGGVKYPNGVVIGGVSYPPGTVVGGIAFPPGTVLTGITFPTGTIIGGVYYPTGTVTGTVTYPAGTVIGGVTFPAGTITSGVIYPSGTVSGGVIYPSGRVSGGVTYPNGTVTGTLAYPNGTIIGGISYPNVAVIGGVTYPTATVIGGVTYPTGTVIGGITYPSGVVIGGVTYPPGTVVGGVAFPPGTVTAGFTFPSATVIGGVAYPSGAIIGSVTVPTGVVIGGVTYPSGVITGGVSYPSSTVNISFTYPDGTIIGGVSYPNVVVIGGVTYTTATVIGGVTYPSGSVIGGITYPGGVIIGGISYPAGTIVGGVAFPPGTITGNYVFPSGSVIGGVIYPGGTVSGGVIYPSGTVIGAVSYPSGTVIGGVTYPTGMINAGVLYPTGGISGATMYPEGLLNITLIYNDI